MFRTPPLALLSLLLATHPAAGEPKENGAADALDTAPVDNAAPRFERIHPYVKPHQAIQVQAGETLTFLVHARDPDGTPLTFSSQTMPSEAKFDSEKQTFTWSPTNKDRGMHAVLFRVSDGDLIDNLALTIEVAGNRPPRATEHTLRGTEAHFLSHEVITDDPDGDAITYTSDDLPENASLDPSTGMFTWFAPSGSGPDVRFSVKASDGKSSTLMPVHIQLKRTVSPSPRSKTSDEWESFLQPGIGYAFFAPGDSDSLGAFSGAQFELNFISWIHRNDSRGPSHGRLYIKAELLRSSRDSVPDLFLYSGGLTLSLERNPKRSWLIPHYGVELGGLTHPHLGGAFQTTAFGGLHLWASRNLFVNLTAGYFLVPENMKQLGGFRAGASAEFSLW